MGVTSYLPIMHRKEAMLSNQNGLIDSRKKFCGKFFLVL